MSERTGFIVKHSYNNDFVELISNLKEKYPDEVFKIQGIHNDNLDINRFSKRFFEKSVGIASSSVDANANVKDKTICDYNYESPKAMQKIHSIYLMYKWVKKIYGVKDAKTAVEKVISGEIFVNDLTSFHIPYCFAFDLDELLVSGFKAYKGLDIKPPKRSETFIQLLIQATAYFSNQIVGASSYPNFFPILDWFYRNELGENYIEKLKLGKSSVEGSDLNNVYNKIKNQFQNLIYSFNFPFRGNQSAFTNLSVMDDGFLHSLFDNYILPDGTNINFNSTKELSKLFFIYFNEIFGKEGVFTFPVLTLAISLDENKEYMDYDFVKWCAKENHKKAVSNIFQDKPTSFSSCCRLKNDFSKLASDGVQNSFGVSGVNIGSLRVCGLNLARLGILEKSNPNILSENVDINLYTLYAQKQLLKYRLDSGLLPLYTTNWINIRKQYSTVGLVAMNEYIENLGMNIVNEDGLNKALETVSFIEKEALKWEEQERSEGCIYNIESIPAESMAVRLAKLDTVLGYNDKKLKLYSNQYIPLTKDATLYDRARVQGEMDGLTSGGAILHVTVFDDKGLSEEQYLKVMKDMKDLGVSYFGVNYCYSECENGHISIGDNSKCPKCDGEIIEKYARVVGFVTPKGAWNDVRKNYEFQRRKSYSFSEGLNNANS